MEIRDAIESDFESIIHLNRIEEKQTSPMNLERLIYLDELASFHMVALIDKQIAGFLIALRESTPYQNINYAWFASRYEKYFYVDRIVVSKNYSGMKVGSSLYSRLMSYASDAGINRVVCEFNIDPPNLASRAFHEKLGFNEVGRQYVSGEKYVSMQMYES